jgi:phosphatidylethanolamine/phosphatidyl-N-methylethanolamine N-methyltransferase
MRTEQVASAYACWAPIYDIVFGPVFRQGRSAAAQAAERHGGRILEVGVGTGISLATYKRTSRITAVDISPPMLEKARRRAAALGLSNVEAIEVMDAERLQFPDAAFDVVVAQYVVTAVPNPERALDEFARVVKPGGEIVIATRMGAAAGLRGVIERGLMPVTSRARLSHRVPLDALSALDRALARPGTDRATDAAPLWTFRIGSRRQAHEPGSTAEPCCLICHGCDKEKEGQ